MYHWPAAGRGCGFGARRTRRCHRGRGARDMTKRNPATERKPTRRNAVAARPVQRPAALLTDVRELILSAREQVAQTVNAGLTMLYWHIGRRIRQEVLNEKRGAYGAEVVSALGRRLETGFGRGLCETSLL